MKTMYFYMIIAALLALVLASSILPTANAGSTQYNVDSGPGTPKTVLSIKQDWFPIADGLEFNAWIRGTANYKITGWRITINEFPTVLCGRSGTDQALDISAYGNNILYGQKATGLVELWVNPYLNRMEIVNVIWSKGGVDRVKAIPDQSWAVTPPTEKVYVKNIDPADRFTIYDFKWHVSATSYSDLTLVPFDQSIPGTFIFERDQFRWFDTPFGGLTDNAYLYFHYKMQNATGQEVAELWASHNIEAEYSGVGGTMITVDKLNLLGPYIGLLSTMVVAAVVVTIFARTIKRRKHK
ncbi:MAG: hypothetical protein ACFFDE_06925 [Promethearchaeota archaeon]